MTKILTIWVQFMSYKFIVHFMTYIVKKINKDNSLFVYLYTTLK